MKKRLQSKRVTVLVLVAVIVTALSIGGVAAANTSASSPGLPVVAPKKCGDNIYWKKQDPDGVLKKLSKATQAKYQNYPYEVRATPWSNFAAKPGPWQIGYVSFPVDNPWMASLLAQTKKEFAKAKAKGLVSGTLQTYVQPSWATATPEQQVNAIQQMVRDGVDAIILRPLNPKAETAAFDAAGKAGVPIVILGDAAPDSKYAVNVLTENVSQMWAGTLKNLSKNGIIGNGKTINMLNVRGIPGLTIEEQYNDAVVADAKACAGVEIVGTVWGKWNPATAKAEVQKFLASHPGQIDLVYHGSVMPGVIEAFQQTGRSVPYMSLSGCTGGDLTWWSENKNLPQMKNMVGSCYSGAQVGYTGFRIVTRILGGRGLKIRDINIPAPVVTSANINVLATPGKPLSWIGSPRGPLDAWGAKSLNDYFKKPGNPGGM